MIPALPSPLLLALLQALSGSAASDGTPAAPALDPRGLWLHAWTGSSAGTAWVSVRASAGGYRLADVRGRGFEFALEPSGELHVTAPEGASGGGRFEGPDRAVLDVELGEGGWRSGVLVRAPGTAPDVLLEGDPAPGAVELSGTWRALGEELGPTTGAVLRERELACDVEVRGARIRLSFPDGNYDQGVFLQPDRILFQVVEPAPRDADPRLLDPRFVEAMATTRNHDVLGFGRVLEGGRIELVFLLESRGAVGARTQHLYRYRLERG